MENFVAYNPTKLVFGRNVIEQLPDYIKNFGSKVLLLTGKGNVKKYGYYDSVLTQLYKAGKQVFEFSGIQPNPRLQDAEKAVAFAREKQIDCILALGGGSVIDTAKMANMGYANAMPIWEIMKHKEVPKQKVPLVAVLTLAATGTEMNGAAVLQNMQIKEKIGYYSPLMYPDVSFLDPTYTFSVGREQTVNGMVDLIAHSLEAYFSDGDAPLSDRFVAANILETFDYAEALLQNPTDYELRARMMWTASIAENGTTMYGRKTAGDWGTHALAHHISLLWDTAHGQTLSVMFPAWMKANQERIENRLKYLGYLLTGNAKTSASESIQILENFFNKIGAPTRFEQLGLKPNDKRELLDLWLQNRPSGYHIKLTESDYQNIISTI